MLELLPALVLTPIPITVQVVEALGYEDWIPARLLPLRICPPPPSMTFPLGQVAFAGADSPPLVPGITWVSPRKKLELGVPAGPVAPLGPVAPVAPVGPTGPVAPVAPVSP